MHSPFGYFHRIEFGYAFQKVLVLGTFSLPSPTTKPHLLVEIIISILQNERVSCAGCYDATCLAQNLNYFNN